jgi:hypothetical protein
MLSENKTSPSSTGPRMARGVQHEDPDRRGEIGGAAAGVDRRDEVRQRLPARGRDLPQLFPKNPFQRNAGAMAGDAQRMLDDFF